MRPARHALLLATALSGCTADALPPLPDLGGTGDASAGSDLAPAPPDLLFAPAPHPPAPQIPDNGGPKLTRPQLVTITWQGDPLEKPLADFGSWLVTSHYFTGSLAEYGISPGTAESVVLPAIQAPATLDDSDLRTLLKSSIDAKVLPPVSADRLYVLYPPDGVTVTYGFGGNAKYKSCTQFQAYHEVGPPTVAGDVIYVVVPRCHLQGTADLDYTTWGASERIAEAVTDPTGKGWRATSLDLAWANGGEVTGPCAGHQRIVEGHVVNALYSNMAAARDQRACVPAPPGPAFGFTADPDTLQLAGGVTGMSAVRVWSSAPLPRALRVDVYGYPQGQVTVKAGSALADNGQVVPLAITAAPGATPGSQLYVQVTLSAADYWINGYLMVLVR